MLRSAVFMVPMMIKFGGTARSSPLWGSLTDSPRLSFSMSVISSPKTFGMLPRLISSMRRTKRSSGEAAAALHRSLNTPSVRASSSWPLAVAWGRKPSTKSS